MRLLPEPIVVLLAVSKKTVIVDATVAKPAVESVAVCTALVVAAVLLRGDGAGAQAPDLK